MVDSYRYAEDRYLLVGKIAKPHGIRGEVKIIPFSDDAETLLHYRRVVLVDGQGRTSPALTVDKARMHGKAVVLKLAAVDDRNEAESLHGLGLLVFKEDLPAIEEDEFYWFQYYGLPVSTEDGTILGTIKAIFSNGAQDIMVVDDGSREYLIPVLDTIIREQTDKGVVIAPPPGLLGINTGFED